MEHYRLFIAAELPANIQAELIAAQVRLRQANLPVSWVAPEAMHLTLRFLGETSVARLPSIEHALQAALAPHGSMILQLSGTGGFPNDRRPSVVWAGVSGEVAALARMQADIETAVIGMGFAPEVKSFRAHLTLGRIRRETGPEQQQQLGAAIRALPPLAALAWEVERVGLFRSELRGDGSIYTKIVDCKLQIAD